MAERPLQASRSGSVSAHEVLASLRAKLDEMELHDDLPDSFDLGYMAAWSEIKRWMDKEPGR